MPVPHPHTCRCSEQPAALSLAQNLLPPNCAATVTSCRPSFSAHGFKYTIQTRQHQLTNNREFFLRDTWRSGSWSACDTHAKPEVTYLIPGLLHPLTFRDYINRVYPHPKRRVPNGDCIANANGHGRAHSKSFTTPGFATSIVAADGQ